MAWDVLLTIAATSLIQSIFGVGVLLFGTPILLTLGYDFTTAITYLLPISLTINLLQIACEYKRIDKRFYFKMLKYTIPFVILFLFIVTTFEINIGLAVGIFLLIVASKDYLPKIKRNIELSMKYEKTYLALMGIIHGSTNLGGSLLTAMIHSRNYEKSVTRATVAASYATFAVFQIATLLLANRHLDVNFPAITSCLVIGVMIFVLTEKIIYIEIDDDKYSRYFAIFLFVSGLLLCIKSLS